MIKQKISNNLLLLILIVLAVVASLAYEFIFIDMKYFDYALKIRTPKLLAMLIASFCIGSASIVFQSVINNRIVTPCLLGMNALYILTHTVLFVVLGSASVFITSKNIAFLLDLVIMGLASTTIYSYLFRKTKYNVLYVLLVGTVLATLFTSITNTLIRGMDPNEFISLQDKLIAGFNNVNSSILSVSAILIFLIAFILRKEIRLLDVITLGKNQAINLGVDFDRSISRLLLGVTLYIAIATALVGPISFLGLIIANISRQFFNTYKHKYLMVGAALFGMIILTIGQSLIEHVFSFNTAISVFINILGGIYFLYLILKTKGV